MSNDATNDKAQLDMEIAALRDKLAHMRMQIARTGDAWLKDVLRADINSDAARLRELLAKAGL